MPENNRLELVKKFGERIIEIHKGVSLLSAIKWPSGLEDFLYQTDFKINPQINFDTFNQVDFFTLKESQITLFKIDLDKHFRKDDEIHLFFTKQVGDVAKIVEMIQTRGSARFYELSKELYGSIKFNEVLFNKIEKMYFNFKNKKVDDHPKGKIYTAYEAKLLLENRLQKHFPSEKFKVKLSSKMTSDASTGSNYIKINSHHKYSKEDIALFEYHEGLVHLGSNLNASYEPNAPWLLKSLPQATMSQEGLAVFVEFFCETMNVKRLEMLFLRVLGIKLAEEGKNFIEVINYFRQKGVSDRKAINVAKRVFRGASLEGGSAFTKDLSYLLGFIEVYEFIHKSLLNKTDHIEFLFSGKVSVKDVALLVKLESMGIINRPKYVPAIFKNKSELLAKMVKLDLFEEEKIIKKAA